MVTAHEVGSQSRALSGKERIEHLEGIGSVSAETAIWKVVLVLRKDCASAEVQMKAHVQKVVRERSGGASRESFVVAKDAPHQQQKHRHQQQRRVVARCRRDSEVRVRFVDLSRRGGELKLAGTQRGC